MKHPQINLHTHTMRESQVLRSKNVKIYHHLRQNLSLGQTFLATQFFLFINILLKLQQQILVRTVCFGKVSCISVIIMGLLRFLT